VTFGLTGRRFPFSRLNLGPKAVMSAALLIAINTALLVGAGYWSLTRDFDIRAKRDIDLNLRTLSLAFGETFQDAKITIRDGVVDRIEIPKMPEFADHRIVDRATSYVGGNATLFVYDDASQQFVRRTTNVKKENGDRAVGTQLAADHPGQAVLRRGEAYKGPAMLFGRRFFTAYQPVFDPAGNVIGTNPAAATQVNQGFLGESGSLDGSGAGRCPERSWSDASNCGHDDYRGRTGGRYGDDCVQQHRSRG